MNNVKRRRIDHVKDRKMTNVKSVEILNKKRIRITFHNDQKGIVLKAQAEEFGYDEAIYIEETDDTTH